MNGKGTDTFKAVIQNYLEYRASTDELFAPRFANPLKSIDECCKYIIGEVYKSGMNGFDDDEIFSMAVHYYPKYIKIQSHHIRYPYNQCIIRLTLCYDFG